MRPVIQLERTGCGIASTACIAGISYAKAKLLAASLGISARDERLWSRTSHVLKLLRHLDIQAGLRPIPFRRWDALPDLALLAIKWHLEKGHPCWHWVVFVRGQGRSAVLDSRKGLRSHRRTDFGRIKPKWYIPVAASHRSNR